MKLQITMKTPDCVSDAMHWRVCRPNGRWIGIIETNWPWASNYWLPRGFILVEEP